MLEPNFDIEPADTGSRERVRQRLDELAKPPGSLGRLEEIAVDLAGMQHRDRPTVDRARVVIGAASHTVADRRPVSAYPSETTASIVEAFCGGSAAVNVLSDRADLGLEVLDLGVEGVTDDLAAREPGVTLQHTEISAPGASDIVEGPAVEPSEAECALAAGIEAADRAANAGAEAICLGDVGIGNTTAAAAVAARLLDRPPGEVTGPGSGLDDQQVDRKAEVVRQALERTDVGAEQPLEVLAQLGGPDYLAMAGCSLGAASRRMTVILDGYIVSTAVLAATLVDERVCQYVLPASLSPEPGHREVLEAAGVGEPLLDWSLRLGEASAATLVVPLLKSACAIVDEMATLDEILRDDTPAGGQP